MPSSLTNLLTKYTDIIKGKQEDYLFLNDTAQVLTYYTNYKEYVQLGECLTETVPLQKNETQVPCRSIFKGDNVTAYKESDKPLVNNIYLTLKRYLTTSDSVLTNLTKAIKGDQPYGDSPNLNW